MSRINVPLLVALLALNSSSLLAQQPADPTAVEAKKDVVVTWTLNGQTWDFKAVQSAYEPIKGSYDPLRNEARWTFQIVKDMEPGAAALHTQTKNTPFKPIMLNADKLIMANDGKVQMTESSGKAGERIEVYFQLPDPEVLATIKHIRLERRTNIGF